MKDLLKRISATLVIALGLVGVHPALQIAAIAAPCEPGASVLGIPTWYKYLDGEEVRGKCRPIINETKDTLPIGLAIFEIALTLAGLVAVVMIFIGAIKFILSQGESDKAAAGRKTVINAAIGLAITLVAARVVTFVAESLTS